MRLLVGLLVSGGLGLLGLWWWRGRTPADRGSHVSSTWLDEHIRGSKHDG
jgi:hypothetical protein